jgi:hypothetical protein
MVPHEARLVAGEELSCRWLAPRMADQHARPHPLAGSDLLVQPNPLHVRSLGDSPGTEDIRGMGSVVDRREGECRVELMHPHDFLGLDVAPGPPEPAGLSSRREERSHDGNRQDDEHEGPNESAHGREYRRRSAFPLPLVGVKVAGAPTLSGAAGARAEPRSGRGAPRGGSDFPGPPRSPSSNSPAQRSLERVSPRRHSFCERVART